MSDSPLLTDRVGRFRLFVLGAIREPPAMPGRRRRATIPSATNSVVVLRWVMSLALLLGLASAALAADSDNLPLPRFASLKSDEVNLRAGPGEDKPKLWVYQRAGMPVEIIDQFDTWRQIRDYRGTVGWVSSALLSGRRTAIVTDTRRTLLASPDPASRPVALVDPGVIGRLLECQGQWCRLEIKSYEGWLKRGEFWGVYPDESPKE